MNFAEGNNVRDTLQLLQGHYFLFENLSGEPFYFSDNVTVIKKFTEEVVQGINVSGQRLNLYKSIVYGEDIYFVTSSQKTELTVPQAFLEAKYPGWQDRWHAAEELELEEDWKHFVFSKAETPKKSASLENIVFD